MDHVTLDVSGTSESILHEKRKTRSFKRVLIYMSFGNRGIEFYII